MMEKKKGAVKMIRRVLFGVFSFLLFALLFALLFLNKSALWGLIVFVLATAAIYAAHHRMVRKKVKRGLRALLWLGWIGVFAGLVFLAWPATKAVPAVPDDNPEKTEIIALADGQVRGVYNRDRSVRVFAGIPYARPPVGELRWKAPQDPIPWEGVLEADTFAPMSMQPVNLPIYDSLAQIIGYHDYEPKLNETVAPVSEDALYLNVWAPAAGEQLPVLVYVHGGSLQTGQPWYADYSGEGLAKRGVIVVNMGYRLGIFGFLAEQSLAEEDPNHSTGNYGLLDQIKALQWVQSNIAAFGGDPSNVTLAGESAGSACVSALCTSPLAGGLFQRVILESSTLASVQPPHSFRTMEEALAEGASTLRKYNCKTVDELRKLPAEDLVDEADVHHHITVDGWVLTETPCESYRKGIHNESAILHGYNSEESAPFLLFDNADLKDYRKRFKSLFGESAEEALALYPAGTDKEAAANWAEVFGAAFFDYPHYCLNRLAAENGIPTYEYYFSKANGRIGPWHSGEMVYCYGNLPAGSRLYDQRDRELSEQMAGYWANFAASGDPNGPGLPEWTVNTGSDTVMGLGETTGMIPERKHALFAIFDKLEGFAVSAAP